VAIIADMNMLLPSLAAVLAGSVFGDHCSPISDTTILSATGAGVSHIDHVITQLPYALLAAFAASLGYVVIGFTGKILPAIVVTLIFIIVIGMFMQFLAKTTLNKN